MSDRFEELREEYEGSGLDAEAFADPAAMFDDWVKVASNAEIPLANAMALATADGEGRPSVRMVLLKNIDADNRLWFFTDYGSKKGRELRVNQDAEVLFYWRELHRQIRVSGPIKRLADEDSETYFKSRARSSNLSAMASEQSAVLPAGVGPLEKAREELTRQFDGQSLTRPPRWGGYGLSPTAYEFWQGRPDRLHHRLQYLRDGDGWKTHWLSP